MEKAGVQKFYKFRGDVMLNTFQIKSVTHCEHLSEWVTALGLLSDYENTTLNIALQRYADLGRGWNKSDGSGRPIYWPYPQRSQPKYTRCM